MPRMVLIYSAGSYSASFVRILLIYRYRASMPTIETLVEMCEVFEITLAEFFMVEDKNEELIRILNGLSDSSKELLMEVAKRMKE